MLRRVLLLAGAAIGLTGFLLAHPKNRPSQSPPAVPATLTPVVVELFTSEGCSSCPPADALLAKMQTGQPFSGVRVIAMEEHVDYWNQQGWIDPFSSAEWTERQQSYVSALGHDAPYTPQMVVNGRTQFVGSRAQQAVETIESARQLPIAAVELSRQPATNSSELHFSVTVAKLPQISSGDSAEVWLAVTESGLGSQVKGGENAGKRLSHAPVLRSMRRLGKADADQSASFRGDASLKMKSDWKRENLAAVVLVQEKKSRRILGAATEAIGN